MLKSVSEEINNQFDYRLLPACQPSDFECTNKNDPLKLMEPFRKFGCVVVRNLMSQKVEKLKAAVDNLVREARKGNQPAVFGQSNVFNVKPVHVLIDTYKASPELQSAVFEHEITNILGHLIGLPVSVFGSGMCVYKEPGLRTNKLLHQDAPYFYHEKHLVCLVFIPLTFCDETNGCLRFVPGSHLYGLLEHEDSSSFLAIPERVIPFKKSIPILTNPGDVIFMNYMTVHGSDLNLSSKARPLIVIQYRNSNDRQIWKSTSWTKFLGIPCD